MVIKNEFEFCLTLAMLVQCARLPRMDNRGGKGSIDRYINVSACCNILSNFKTIY